MELQRWRFKMASWRSKNPSIPYRFSWFVEGKLAGMAYPDEGTIDYLARSGIKMLINLTEEPSTYEQKATEAGIECRNIRIECFGPPALEQVSNKVRLHVCKINFACVFTYMYFLICMCVCLRFRDYLVIYGYKEPQSRTRVHGVLVQGIATGVRRVHNPV